MWFWKYYNKRQMKCEICSSSNAKAYYRTKLVCRECYDKLRNKKKSISLLELK